MPARLLVAEASGRAPADTSRPPRRPARRRSSPSPGPCRCRWPPGSRPSGTSAECHGGQTGGNIGANMRAASDAGSRLSTKDGAGGLAIGARWRGDERRDAVVLGRGGADPVLARPSGPADLVLQEATDRRAAHSTHDLAHEPPERHAVVPGPLPGAHSGSCTSTARAIATQSAIAPSGEGRVDHRDAGRVAQGLADRRVGPQLGPVAADGCVEVDVAAVDKQVQADGGDPLRRRPGLDRVVGSTPVRPTSRGRPRGRRRGGRRPRPRTRRRPRGPRRSARGTRSRPHRTSCRRTQASGTPALDRGSARLVGPRARRSDACDVRWIWVFTRASRCANVCSMSVQDLAAATESLAAPRRAARCGRGDRR